MHGRGTSLAQLRLLLTLLVDTLSDQLGVLVGSILGRLRTSPLEGKTVSLVLDALGSDKSLDLRGLGVGLRSLLLGGHLTTDDELAAQIISILLSSWLILSCIPNIILLGKAEKAADLGGALRTEALGLDGIGEAGDI